jgi:ribonuclease T1
VPVLRRVRRPLVALVVLIVLLVIGYAVAAFRDGGSTHSAPPTTSAATRSGGLTGRTSSPSQPRAAEVPLSSLPAQAATTVALVQRGGPFPYRQDGVVFGNLERHLPERPRGYYHEYTVPTPGESDRGARRIITGADGEYYYTADHYQSFRPVDVNR